MNRRYRRRTRTVRDLLVLVLIVAAVLCLVAFWGTIDPNQMGRQRSMALLWLGITAGMWVVILSEWNQIMTPTRSRWHGKLGVTYSAGCLVVAVVGVVALVGNVDASLWRIATALNVVNQVAGLAIWLYRPAGRATRSSGVER